MSRIGKQPVPLAGASAEIASGKVVVKGKLGELSLPVPATVSVEQEGDALVVKCIGAGKQANADHGTVRAHLANMVKGVTAGYVKELEIQGVGYKATAQGRGVKLSVGFSHDIDYEPPETVKLEVSGDGLSIKVSGTDKQQVGLVASRIRAFQPPEPYKGKGIRYKGENVRRKVGKTVA